jgi:hypothetical protein
MNLYFETDTQAHEEENLNSAVEFSWHLSHMILFFLFLSPMSRRFNSSLGESVDYQVEGV